jgi:SAM-dependent methyltransferase
MWAQSLDFEMWIKSSAGQYLMAWEQARVDIAVVDTFGYYAFQLGLCDESYLKANRMQHRVVAALAGHDGRSPNTLGAAALVLDPHYLPFQANNLDLLVYPHVLERSEHPQQALREAERVLVPEGRLVICGVNPYSFMAMAKLIRSWISSPERPIGENAVERFRPIAFWRMRDWLALLGFEIESVYFGGGSPGWLQSGRPRQWLSGGNAKLKEGPFFGRAYVIVANKKVPGMRLISNPWQVRARVTGRAAQAVKLARAVSYHRLQQDEHVEIES